MEEKFDPKFDFDRVCEMLPDAINEKYNKHQLRLILDPRSSKRYSHASKVD